MHENSLSLCLCVCARAHAHTDTHIHKSTQTLLQHLWSIASILQLSVSVIAWKTALSIRDWIIYQKQEISKREPSINLFSIHLAVGQTAAVLDQKPMLIWVSNFVAIGLALKRKPRGKLGSVRTRIKCIDKAVNDPLNNAKRHKLSLNVYRKDHHLDEIINENQFKIGLRFIHFYILCNDVLKSFLRLMFISIENYRRFFFFTQTAIKWFGYYARIKPTSLSVSNLVGPRLIKWRSSSGWT